MNIAILILAAGESKRLGRAKQLLDWNGETLLQNSISIAQQVSSEYTTEIYLVLGARYNELLPYAQDKDIVICHNERWFTGIGSSIQSGMEAIATREKFNAVLIMLCDQPFITSNHLQILLEQFSTSQKGIVATSYSGTNGVPAIFGREYFAELQALGSEQGAKRLIEQYVHDVESIAFENAKIDIDTMEDYNNALQLERLST